MKIEFNETHSDTIDEDFRGLAKCHFGAVWLIAESGAVCFSDDPKDQSVPPLVYDALEWKQAIKNQGPFTKYNGQLVIEND